METNTANQIAQKPAIEATYFERLVAHAMQGSITCDGSQAPETHAEYAIRVPTACVAKLAALQNKAQQ